MKKIFKTVILILLPIICIGIGMFIGRYSMTMGEVFDAIFNSSSVSYGNFVVLWQLRLPRALAAAFCGAALSVSGAAYQGVFKNPLVNSGILGISNGAGLGACIAIIFFAGGIFTYIFAFVFSIVAVCLAYLAGRISGTSSTVSLILGGTIISSFFSALISILKCIADPYSQLPSITFWFMGSFADINYSHFLAFIPMTIGMITIFLCRWRINALSLGDKECDSLGVDTKLYSLLIIGGASLATSSAVCISGTIGWVGLIIPHIGRMIIGNDNRKLIPVSISLGASFMVLMDILSRNISSSEVPIGILCSLIGTPFFVYLLKKTKGGNWK